MWTQEVYWFCFQVLKILLPAYIVYVVSRWFLSFPMEDWVPFDAAFEQKLTKYSRGHISVGSNTQVDVYTLLG